MHFHVVSAEYRHPHPVELTVTKNTASLSGEGFTITDPEGRVVFKMDGHFLSVRDRCVLQDPEGRPILSARKKLASMHERWEVVRGEHFEEANQLFTVKKASVVQLKTHLEVYLPGKKDDDKPDFEVKGNFKNREVQIFYGDAVIAEVKRKFTVGNVLLDKHTFVVCTCPNVDQAFVVALIIIMDRIDED